MINDSHFYLLGLTVKDAVTGYSGVVSSLSFDLYGCIQASVVPPMDKDGKIEFGQWFDVTRLIVTNKKPVMDLPDFFEGYVSEGRKGCAEKTVPHI